MTWQTHRFRDAVAVYLEGGATVYLSYEQAREMARGINLAAWSIERSPFHASASTTREGDSLNRNRPLPEVDRRADGTARRRNKGQALRYVE